MKTFVKIAQFALLVLLAFTLVTCDDFLMGLNPNPKPEGEVDYTDWEYEDMPDGTSQLTVYLDGTQVPVTDKTGKPKPGRALNLQLAKMSHDYFEVVFYHDTPETVARATWELGQAAGISGVYRSGGGVNYRGITPGASGSVIFVGRKQTMTLLGVGVLTHINRIEIPSGGRNLLATDRSVTFTVSPLEAKIGIDEGTNLAISGSSFITSVGVDFAGDFENPGESSTIGRLTPLGGAEYPLFILPDLATLVDNGGTDTVAARYTIGGLSITAVPGNPATNLAQAVLLYDVPEVIKREPRYISGGQVWYAVAQVDFGATEVAITGTHTADTAVNPQLDIEFTLSADSNGIFSIVFSIPVYAFTDLPSTNVVGGQAEIWHITPGYGQNLYNLDNGKDAGGCVLLGINVSSLDWLEIFTTGLGFNN